MKNIVVHVRLPAYLRSWLTHTLGDPVRFPARSYESLLLSRLVTRRPGAAPIEGPGPDTVAMIIPDNALKRPEYYNYLGRRGRAEMTQAVERLFRLHLWSEAAGLIGSARELNRGIDEWCRANGIGIDAREAVRQKFYRMRRDYMQFGIILGRKYAKKSCHDSGQN